MTKLTSGKTDLWATTDPVGRYLELNKEAPDEVAQRLQKALDELCIEGLVQQLTSSYL